MKIPPDYFDWIAGIEATSRPIVVQYSVQAGVVKTLTIGTALGATCPSQ